MPNAERPVVDSERAHLFGSIVRPAAGYDEALALIDTVLGASARGRLTPWELASARREAACRFGRSSQPCDGGLTRCLVTGHRRD